MFSKFSKKNALLASLKQPRPLLHPQVARLLCVALGETFCSTDAGGQAAAAALLRDAARWAADDRLLAIASELVSEALVSADDEAAAPPQE